MTPLTPSEQREYDYRIAERVAIMMEGKDHSIWWSLKLKCEQFARKEAEEWLEKEQSETRRLD